MPGKHLQCMSQGDQSDFRGVESCQSDLTE